MRTYLLPLHALLFLALAGPALAVDGVREVNQTCAVNTGCFPGDGAGFPVTISTPGSYVLTGNLAVSNANDNAIAVILHGVSINLNGFEIAGPVTCTGLGSSISCDPGFGHGINGVGRARMSVRDGSVRGFAQVGVPVTGQCASSEVYLSEEYLAVVRKTQLLFPILHQEFLFDHLTPSREIVDDQCSIHSGLWGSRSPFAATNYPESFTI